MSVYEHDCRTLTGEPFNLHALKGQVLLIVNVASKCGFTPQLRELDALYNQYRDQGFMVLAFPCNQFAHQAPEQGEAFAQACSVYRPGFPFLEKVNVNGSQAHPLFRDLKRSAPGVLHSRAIKWNFTKFLVGRNGDVLKRFGPRVSPLSLRSDVETALDIPMS